MKCYVCSSNFNHFYFQLQLFFHTVAAAQNAAAPIVAEEIVIGMLPLVAQQRAGEEMVIGMLPLVAQQRVGEEMVIGMLPLVAQQRAVGELVIG